MDAGYNTVDFQCWEKRFYCESSQTLGKIAQGSCGISTLGELLNLAKQGPEKPELQRPCFEQGFK